MLKYSDNSIEEDGDDNSLDDDLLGYDLLGNDSFAHIDSNIDIDTKANPNPDEGITGNNLLKENSGINIENLF